jgi:nitrate reductase assembly molybdenum cofactor insertion protein NarJ
MAGLKEHYGTYGFSEGAELPDRLSVMLRFLTLEEDAEQAEIIDWCLVPALEKMVAELKDGSNPYRVVLQALLLTLKDGWKN